MIIHDVEQGSVEWLLARAGVVTASEAENLVTGTGKIRDGEMVTSYRNKKLVEKWTGGPLPSLQGIFDVEQGELLESKARPAFTIHTGLETRTVGFITSDDGKIGCSPDALVGESSGCEIKCPRLETQIGYLLSGKVPKDYLTQIQFSMFVTGFQTWHFFSYHRSLCPLHLVVARDENFQRAITCAVEDFIKLLDASMKRLEELNGGTPNRAPVSQPCSKPAPETPTPYGD